MSDLLRNTRSGISPPAGDEQPFTPNSSGRQLPGYEHVSGLSGAEAHLSDYLRLIYKRRWPAATAFLLVFVSACIYTFTATPIYDARVQILIEKEASNVVDVQGGHRTEPGRRRLLPDAVQDPAEPRPGPPDDRRAEPVDQRAVQRRRTFRRLLRLVFGEHSEAAGFSSAISRRNEGAIEDDRPVPQEPDGLAHSQQPPR